MPGDIKGCELFTAREVELIRALAKDWLYECLVLPPFEPDLEGLRKKLNMDNEDTAPENYQKSQERLSPHGVK